MNLQIISGEIPSSKCLELGFSRSFLEKPHLPNVWSEKSPGDFWRKPIYQMSGLGISR